MKKEDKFYIEYCTKCDCDYKVMGNWYSMMQKQMKEHMKKHKKKPLKRRQTK